MEPLALTLFIGYSMFVGILIKISEMSDIPEFLLDDEYRRTKSLTECFNSDWWRTHPKRSFYCQ